MKTVRFQMIVVGVAAFCVSAYAGGTVTRNGSLTIDGGSVTPNTKYRLTFSGTVSGADVLEKNPDVEQTFFSQAGAEDVPLAGWQLRFIDQYGDIQMGGVYQNFHQKMIFEDTRTYTQDFHAPHFAEQLEIRFYNPSANRVVVTDVRVVPLKEDAINVNASFNLGEFNFSGYGRATQARIKITEDGTSYLAIAPTRYGRVVTDPIPVAPGRVYRVSLIRHGEAQENIIVYGRFLDTSFRKIEPMESAFTFHAIWKYDHPGFRNYTASENAAYLEFLITGGNIATFRVDEVPPRD